MAFALELSGIRKTFDGVVALDGAVFSAKPGEVHALLGENGAGKSSLMNIAAGFYVPDAGTLAVNGEMVALSGPADARRLARSGVAVVLVTHKLNEVKRHADAVTIMRGGRTVATPDPHAASTAELTELTVGQTAPLPVRAERPRGATRLNVGALHCARNDGQVMVSDASFFVRAGEIYGLAGVSGNGQAELAETLIGAREPLSGEIWLEGPGDVAPLPPAVRREAG